MLQAIIDDDGALQCPSSSNIGMLVIFVRLSLIIVLDFIFSDVLSKICRKHEILSLESKWDKKVVVVVCFSLMEADGDEDML